VITTTVVEDCASQATAAPIAKLGSSQMLSSLIWLRSQGAVFSSAAPLLMKSVPRNSRPRPSSAPSAWRQRVDWSICR
jgi:hypothetical protein